MNTLKAEKRDLAVKAKKLRREGYVTGNVFGKEIEGSIPVKMTVSDVETLLKTTGYTLQEICEIIGYDSCAHFSRTFKKRYGLSPSEFRKQRQKTADAPSETRI